MTFETIIKAIGSMILSLIIVVLPILCGLSYGCNWYDVIKFFFTIMTFGEAVVLWALMWGHLN